MNYVSRAVDIGSTVSISGTEDSSWPVAGLYDGRSDVPFKWSAISTDCTITIDINGFLNGDAGSTDVTDWTAALGTLAYSTGASYSAPASLALTVSTGTSGGQFYQDFEVKAGELRTISYAILGPGTTGGEVARLRLADLNTGKSLTSTGGWSSATTEYFATNATTSAFSTGSIAYTVESISICGTPTPNLRLYCEVSSGGATGVGYFDELQDVPGVDYCGIHGAVGILPASPEVHSSTDNFSASDTNEGTLSTDRYPVCFKVLSSPVYRRYWRVKLSGTPIEVPAIGEWILGQTVTWEDNPQYPLVWTFVKPSTRQATPGGMIFDYPLGSYETRQIRVQMKTKTDAHYVEQRELIYGFSRGGLDPIVLIPTEADSGVSIFGKIKETPVDFSHTHLTWREFEWSIAELGMPL
jgi:hypothetical protein